MHEPPEKTDPPWWRRPGDVTAVALLVALPLLVYGIPPLTGHVVLPGDDLTQNFPLRVLAGREIRSGHLPLFDPFAWSGSPLLAGWNAGAAYPLTWLFAVLPAMAAWTAGLVATWATAGIGLFAYLRALRLRALPSFLGALSFALAGAMSAQIPHFGLVAGMSWVPLALLAVLRITEFSGQTGLRSSPAPGFQPLSRRSRRWAAVLAVAVGLIILAGEPRAIVDGFVIIGVYAAWRACRLGLLSPARFRQALPSAALLAVGFGLGVALGAVQLLPGLNAVSSSQRGTGTLALFSDGSLPPRWLFLTLVPDLLGGSGSLSQPAFFGTYNVTEVTSYVGILPAVAACVLLARAVVARLRDKRRGVSEYLVWHLMGLFGALLALGGNSPLGQVLYRLPLFGSQRLQSRNILLLDLALAVLLAYWLDKPFPESRGARVPGVSRGRAWEAAAGLLPPLAVGVLVVAGLTWGAGLLRWLGVDAAVSAQEIGALKPWLIPYAVIAVAAAGLVIFGRRLSRRAWSRVCAAFVVTDVVVFTILGVVRIAPTSSSALVPETPPPSPSAPGSESPAVPASAPARPISDFGYSGRYVIYDPMLRDSGDLSVLGPPNVNDLTPNGMRSAQGYSSIVDGTYAAATGSHHVSGGGQNVLSPAAIGNGTLDSLDTSLLATLPDYLTTTVPVTGGPSGLPKDGERHSARGQTATWFLGRYAPVSRVTVPAASGVPAAAKAGTSIGLTAPDGRTRWFRARAARVSGHPVLEVTLNRPMTATAVLARPGTPLSLGAPTLRQPGGTTLVADGELQNDLTAPRWNLAGFDGGFAVFHDTLAAAPVTARALDARSGASGRYARVRDARAQAAVSVRYASGVSGDGAQTTVTSAQGARVIRSVAAIPGWSATWQPRNGVPVPLAVHRDGVVQAVDVPAGQGTVTWHYMTPRFPAGLAVSGASVLAIATLAAVGRRRPRPAGDPVPARELESQSA